MTFPRSQRETYLNNPLEEVVCQFRFPPILKVESETPTSFQEKIRKDFPAYEQQRVELPQELAKMMPAGLIPVPMSHQFSTMDGTWTISICKDFFALTSKKYVSWKDFSEKFKNLLTAFTDIYQPTVYTRIGLRYRNVIRRSKLGLENISWYELLNESLLGELAATSLREKHFESAIRQTALRLDEEIGQVRLQHGLVMEQPNGEKFYMIDSDFFAEKNVGVNDGTKILESFNQEAGNLFRWCITDRLRMALCPSNTAAVS